GRNFHRLPGPRTQFWSTGPSNIYGRSGDCSLPPPGSVSGRIGGSASGRLQPLIFYCRGNDWLLAWPRLYLQHYPDVWAEEQFLGRLHGHSDEYLSAALWTVPAAG